MLSWALKCLLSSRCLKMWGHLFLYHYPVALYTPTNTSGKPNRLTAFGFSNWHSQVSKTGMIDRCCRNIYFNYANLLQTKLVLELKSIKMNRYTGGDLSVTKAVIPAFQYSLKPLLYYLKRCTTFFKGSTGMFNFF